MACWRRWPGPRSAPAWPGRWQPGAALLLGAAVFSHWLLDALVHAPEMPLAGASSPMLGLGLWDQMPLALALESLIAIGGAAAWLAGSGIPRGRRWGIAIMVLLLLAFTIAGMTLAAAPPSAFVMAASSLLTLVLVVALFAWLGRRGTDAR